MLLEKGATEVCDGRGAFVYGPLELPGMSEEVVAELHHAGARSPVCLVVGEPVHRVDDDFVFESVGVGKLAHLHRVVARYDRRSLQDQPPGGAAANKPGLGPGEPGQFLPGRAVEVLDVDHHPGRLGHQFQGLGTSPGAAQPGYGTGGVDDGRHSQPLIECSGVPRSVCIRHCFLLAAFLRPGRM